MTEGNTRPHPDTVGLDVGDRTSQLCRLERQGEIIEESRVATTKKALGRRFKEMAAARVVLEVGPHSPWISRLLATAGHEVIVANPRKLRLIYENDQKSDRADAEYLARVGRLDPKLLAPVRHRSQNTHAHLTVLRSRDALVRARTALINHVRGSVKAVGGRLPSCGTPSFHRKVEGVIPEELEAALLPLVDVIGHLTEKIRHYDKRIKEISEVKYPETALLRQVPGVGPVTALCYVLTLEDPDRFPTSRSVGPYLGLVPRKRDSGNASPQLRTTKSGDPMLRHLLTQAAHYILGPFGPDTDLRRWGLQIAERGGNNVKKRAIVAVARKLAVLLHSLWSTGEVYEPLRNSQRESAAA
ncbi:MAG: IS110 family transposase [Actinomycetota bacterium]